mmetsp:Transcript_24156/g.60801  ORF Transcript_24156/g.60801 Transcript_24156/m.60801 type:complete len:211 (-) Transcript_24156:32-664(-)
MSCFFTRRLSSLMYMGSPSSCGYSMLALRCTRALRARHFLPRASFMVALKSGSFLASLMKSLSPSRKSSSETGSKRSSARSMSASEAPPPRGLSASLSSMHVEMVSPSSTTQLDTHAGLTASLLLLRRGRIVPSPAHTPAASLLSSPLSRTLRLSHSRCRCRCLLCRPPHHPARAGSCPLAALIGAVGAGVEDPKGPLAQREASERAAQD